MHIRLIRLFFLAVIFLYRDLSADTQTVEANDLLKLMQKRQSGHIYDSTRTVTQEQVMQLIEAARQSPSSYNEQPWYFIICDRQSTPQGYSKALQSLMECNRSWAQQAPLLIVAVTDTKLNHSLKNNLWSQYDTGAAVMSLTLQAAALGLKTHQMGGFNAHALRHAFAIPEHFTPLSIIAVGYEASGGSALPAKKRKPMTENFFWGGWGKSFAIEK